MSLLLAAFFCITAHGADANLMGEIRAELGALDELVDAAAAPAVQKELHRKVDRLESLLAKLEERQPAVRTVIIERVQEPPADTGPEAMSDGDFAALEKQVAAESFANGKISVIQVAAKGGHFTAAQAARLLASFSFDKDKIAAAKLLYPRLTDPGNAAQMLGAFDFDSKKKALSDWMSAQ